jgi:hydrogenase nickel incorporation protein HypA/HybF
MHELSIAENILEIIREHVADERRVKSVSVRVGAMSGVVPDSLEFSFTAITHDTPLASVRLDIEFIPYVLFCRTCRTEVRPEPGLAICPLCGGNDTRIISGTELQVAEIEVEDTT